MSQCILILTVLCTAVVACGRPAPATSSAPIPALSAVAEEGQAPSGEDPNHPVLTFDECRSQPGEVVTDRGDGSLKGCPQGRRELGRVKVGFEGGLCCAPAPVDTAPAPVGSGPTPKQPPCSSDQSCNDDESISALWGTCTPLGVCECKPGFELNVRGRCQRGVR